MEDLLAKATSDIISELYQQEFPKEKVNIQKTRPDVEGDFTIVVFPFTRYTKKGPEQTASEIGKRLKEKLDFIADFNVIKGFLNIALAESFWTGFLKAQAKNPGFGMKSPDEGAAPVVIEYSSPNTNKPLHLGHIRNNLIGDSVSRIMQANGLRVAKVNLVNDRGIHICKSMLAWQKWGDGETPEQAGMKGDHLAGKYYVLFDKAYKKEINQLVEEGIPAEKARKEAPLLKEAQQMLKLWEQGDTEVVALWKKMNQWVYAGFDRTYERMGIGFDKIYHESETYLLGRDIVMQGLEKGMLHQREDGSVWADLKEDGLDEKLLLRADGTSVYMTQDLGTAALRHSDYEPKEMIYVVGNEQIYHFDVLKIVLRKLGFSWHEKVKHLSYGMVELPEGKMKSREGTVVDADNLMDEMFDEAKATTTELGKIEGLSEKQAEELFEMIGLGALKYFILKVDPKKTMTFNPMESIDLNGNTGPFIQYTHARIQSVLRKAGEKNIPDSFTQVNTLHDREKTLLKRLYEFPVVVQQAGAAYSPALIANFVFELVKEYNQFYHDVPILKTADQELLGMRLLLSEFTANTIRKAMGLLGVKVPDKM